MRRVRRLLTVAAILFALQGFLGGPAARGVEGFGGYLLSSRGSAFAIYYNQPSFGLPTAPGEPTAELSGARTQAVSDSGPTGYALASTLWPGSLAANAPPQVSEEIKRGCPPKEIPLPRPVGPIPLPPEFTEHCFPDELKPFVPDLPPYPVRAESFYPQEPHEQDSGIEGSTMSSSAREARSEAVARIQGTRLAGVLEASMFASESRSVIDGALAVTEATTVTRDLDIAGVVKIGAVKTRVRATSDGVTGALEGGVTFADITISQKNAGSFSFTWNEDGIRTPDQNDPRGPTADEINELFDQALGPLGITARVAEPADTIAGASAERAVSALTINMKGETAQPFFDQLPDELKSELSQIISFDQDLTIVLGEVGTRTTAAPVIPVTIFEPPPFVPGTPPQFIPGTPPTVVGGTQIVRENGAPVGTTVATPVSAVGVLGVPAGIAGLLAILALLGGRGLDRFAVGATIAAPGGVRCPTEGS